MRRIIFLALLALYALPPCHSFSVTPSRGRKNSLVPRSSTLLWATRPDHSSSQDHAEAAVLLKSVKKQELVDLCQRMGIRDTKGTKEELLQRLQTHAATVATANEARQRERRRRVESGCAEENPKERYEIVTSPLDIEEDEDEDDDEDFIFYHAPEAFPDDDDKEKESKPKAPSYISQAAVTAPPPPVEPNEKGERVVKVYSTTEQNDLTGIAASQPGQTAFSSDALTTSAPSSQQQQQPWDAQDMNTRSTSSKQEEKAKEDILELVQNLLSMTGLPAFYFHDDDDQMRTLAPQTYTTGFDPSAVDTAILRQHSMALRTGRGAVLQDVLRTFEYQAIGQDGLHGDTTTSGGGHYREVAKVAAFLEGYRRAEVRRVSRETTVLLLDKLVVEGVQGLDMTLQTMTRSGDDTSHVGGELNDSLLEYLSDAIRQQEKKVDALVAARWDKAPPPQVEPTTLHENDDTDDVLDSLWNVTTTEDGQRMESLDPNDPKVKAALEDELVRQEIAETLALERKAPSKPETAPEQLLLLLTLLRERIKAEAVFIPDEKGRNLRLLAYCLQLTTDTERRQLMSKELGNSMDVSC